MAICVQFPVAKEHAWMSVDSGGGAGRQKNVFAADVQIVQVINAVLTLLMALTTFNDAHCMV